MLICWCFCLQPDYVHAKKDHEKINIRLKCLCCVEKIFGSVCAYVLLSMSRPSLHNFCFLSKHRMSLFSVCWHLTVSSSVNQWRTIFSGTSQKGLREVIAFIGGCRALN